MSQLNDLYQQIYYTKTGKPVRSMPDEIETWVAERAALAVCMHINQNTVDANDITSQFDITRCLWGHSPASAASYIADQYYRQMFGTRGE